MLQFETLTMLFILLMWMAVAEGHITSISPNDSDDNCGLEFSTVAERHPWEVTVLIKEKNEWKIMCGGVLININTIVTAASCIQPKNSSVKIKLENIKVKFFGEKADDNKEFGISAALSHENWDATNLNYYAHDIAMLKLDNDIEHFKSLIRPVCLKHSGELFEISADENLNTESNDKNNEHYKTTLISEAIGNSHKPDRNSKCLEQFKEFTLQFNDFSQTRLDMIDDECLNTESNYKNNEHYKTNPITETMSNSYRSDRKYRSSYVDIIAAENENSKCHEQFKEFTVQFHAFRQTRLDMIDGECLNTESNYENEENYKTSPIIETTSNFYGGNDDASAYDIVAENENSEHRYQVNQLNELEHLKWQESYIVKHNSKDICDLKVGSGHYQVIKGKFYLRGIASSAGRGEKFNCSEHEYAIFTHAPDYVLPIDRQQFHSRDDKNRFIEFYEAKSLKREPVCRQNDEELECSLMLATFTTRCKNDINIWDQLNGRQLSSLNVTIDGKSEFCTQYFTQITNLKKLKLDKKMYQYVTYENNEVDAMILSRVLSKLKHLKDFKVENLDLKTLQGSLLFDYQLEKLTFVNNKISKISANFIESLKILKEFTFVKNLITTLSEELFYNNQNLEIIDLSFNQLTILPEGLLKRNNLLKTFNVRHNKLISIHELFFANNLQLKMIELSHNPIRALSEHLLDNLQQLKTFSFEQRSINEFLYSYWIYDFFLPDKFFDNTLALEEINFNVCEICNIEVLPAGLLNNLKKLKKVDFTQNEIKFIPDDFFLNNKDLEIIFILSNKIKKLPENLLKNLPKLKLFDMRDNSITSIAEDFFSNNLQLEEIDMSNNPITTLPDLLFANLETLKVLYLEKLPPNSISTHVVSNNKKLKYLNLSNNENISTILKSENLFKNNVDLQELKISKSGIESLPDNFLKHLKMLKKVDLSYNEINAIPENFFLNNELLENIDFSYNQIEKLPKSLLNGLKSLQTFYLINYNWMTIIIPENFFTVNGEKGDRIFLKLGPPSISTAAGIDSILIRSLLG